MSTDIFREDIKTTPMTVDEYLRESDYAQDKINEYIPDSEYISKIREWFNNTGDSLEIIAYGASWCPDCSRNIPRMIKIVQTLGDLPIKIGIFLGLKTKMRHLRKPGESIWKSPPSPPEAADPKFGLTHIPTFYIFNSKGKCIGTIIENPSLTPTLEGDLAKILNGKN